MLAPVLNFIGLLLPWEKPPQTKIFSSEDKDSRA